MSLLHARPTGAPAHAAVPTYGPLGRLGLLTARRFRAVVVIWVVVTIAFGAFAPRAQNALAGAGWEASGSQSVQARQIVDREFGGLSSSALQVVVRVPQGRISDPGPAAVVAAVERTLRSDSRVTDVVARAGDLDQRRQSHRGGPGRGGG